MEEGEIRIAFCQRLNFFLFCKTSRLALDDVNLLIHRALVALSSGAKRPGQEDNHSPQLVQWVKRFCCLDVHKGHLVYSSITLHKTQRAAVCWMGTRYFILYVTW
jgi:hypothetical protein